MASEKLFFNDNTNNIFPISLFFLPFDKDLEVGSSSFFEPSLVETVFRKPFISPWKIA